MVPRGLEKTNETHIDIFEAVRDRDPEKAVAAMFRHFTIWKDYAGKSPGLKKATGYGWKGKSRLERTTQHRRRNGGSKQRSNSMPKMAIITGFLSTTKDRFHEYNEPLTLEEKFQLMTRIEGYDGVEVRLSIRSVRSRPYQEPPRQVRAQGSGVNVNVKAEPEFRRRPTSHNPDTRSKAVRLIKESKDFATEIGADKVTCCPLGDGYEFSFQYRLRDHVALSGGTFGEAGQYRAEVPLFIEYKPSETRGRCFVDSAAKTSLPAERHQMSRNGNNARFRPFFVWQ